MSQTTPIPDHLTERPLRVAIIGAGPAGVYAADLLTKSEPVASGALSLAIDLFDRYPAPYGLIRYGVAPDHPRIKGIVNALHKVLDRGDIRFFGNVDFGTDVDLPALREHYEQFISDFNRLRPRGGPASFAAQTALVHAWRRFPFIDPDLPDDLLPRDWPRRAAFELFKDRHEKWAPAAQEHFDSLASQ